MRLLNPLFALLGASTDAQLARMVEYLKAENRILRDKLPRRLSVTKQERNRLVKLGRGLGSALKDVITFVSPRRFARWVAGDKAAKKPESKVGRPKTDDDIRKLVLRLAEENGWGYTRILGEVKKLGHGSVCRSTVVNILKEAGLDPGPKRGEGTWADFLKRHSATLWAADFLSVKSFTAGGVVDLYLLFFIHIGTRRVIISNPTAHPNGEWVSQQARNASMQMDDWNLPITHLIIDHDTKFTDTFDAVFEAEGAKAIRVGPLAPNMNAYAERFVQTLRKECLDHFVVCGEKHLRHLVKEFVAHYHEERPHQGRTKAGATCHSPCPILRNRQPCRSPRARSSAANDSADCSSTTPAPQPDPATSWSSHVGLRRRPNTRPSSRQSLFARPSPHSGFSSVGYP